MNRCAILTAWVLASAVPPARADESEVGDAIRMLVPSASSISTKDFNKITSSPQLPQETEFEDKSLTLLLMTHKFSPNDDPKVKKRFEFIAEQGRPKPIELVAELYRKRGRGLLSFSLEPITYIHADRITEVTVDVQGEVAQGSVSFLVPELYRGRVDYAARRTDGKWVVEEFLMPELEIHIIRDKEGTWRKKAPSK